MPKKASKITETPLILLHGFCETPEMWQIWTKSGFPGYKIYTPALAGFYNKPLPASVKTLENYAEDIMKFINEHNLENIVLMGHSMGGYVALHLLEQNPKLFKALGLINSHCFADTNEKKINRNKAIDVIQKHGTAPFVKALFTSCFYNPKNSSKELNFVLNMAFSAPQKSVTNALLAMRNRKSKEEVLKNAKVPVLLISGKQDESVTFEQSLSQSFLADINYFHAHNFSKHMTIFEHPDKVFNQVMQFLKDLK